MSCFDTDCGNDLHCFRPPPYTRLDKLQGGKCNQCDAELIDWDQIQDSGLRTVSELVPKLKKEYVRHVFWHIELDQETLDEIRALADSNLRTKIRKRIKSSIHKKRSEIFRDGMQTPMNEVNIIYYAQHATATCCRKCLKYWYEIPLEKELDSVDTQFCEDLIFTYIQERLKEKE